MTMDECCLAGLHKNAYNKLYRCRESAQHATNIWKIPFEKARNREMTFTTLKVIAIDAIIYIVYHFLLVACSNNTYSLQFPRYYHF